MKVYPIQSSFVSGQLSWKFNSRYDLAVTASGLSICENMITDPRGPCISRGGFDTIAAISGFDDAQTFDWPYSATESYVVVLVDSVLKVFDTETGNEEYSVASPYTASMLGEVHADLAPGNKIMYFAHPDVAQQQLVYDPSVPSWTLSAITFSSPPSQWVANNYPSAVEFGQGRSWWAGCPDDPQTIFASRSFTVGGTYDDMTTGVAADHALVFDLTKSGKVQWLKYAKNMLIGTSNSEHILSSAGLVIVPGDVTHYEQSSYGSANFKPVQLGYELLYLSSDNKKLRSMWYSEQEQGYVSQDVTFTADTEFPADIHSYALQIKPDMYIWCVLDDGSFATCTYNREVSSNPLIGWHFHSLSDGNVKDISVVERGGLTRVIRATQRAVNGTSYIMIESYNPDILLDSREVVVNSPADTAITGVTNLAGKTVQVLVDGAVHADITLDASGNGTLDYDGENIELGFAFRQKMKTLPYIQSGQSGSNASWRKRPNKIFVRLQESGMPLINGVRPPDRSFESVMDEPEPLITGDVQASNVGFDKEGQVLIEQDLPVKLQVTAILGEMQQSSL